MTRTEKIKLLSAGYNGGFSEILDKLADRYSEFATIADGCGIADPATEVHASRIIAELLLAIETMSEATGATDQIAKIWRRQRDDRVELRRIILERSTGHKIIRCDHCKHFRPIGIRPVEGVCCRDPNPNNRSLASADSFCVNIHPITYTSKPREAKHAKK